MAGYREVRRWLWLVLLGLSAAASGAEPSLKGWVLSRATGAQLALDDLRGDPAVLVFWSQDCADCRRLLPGLQRLHERHADAGLQVVGVHFGAPDAAAAEVFARLELDFELLIDGDALAASWAVQQAPVVFFFDAAGTLRHRSASSDPDDPLLDILADDLLGVDADTCDAVLC